MSDGVDRRTVLRRSIILGTVGIAGCTEADDTGPPVSPGDRASPSPVGTQDPTPTPRRNRGTTPGGDATTTDGVRETGPTGTEGDTPSAGAGTETHAGTTTSADGTRTDGSYGTPTQGRTPTPQTHVVEVGPAGTFRFVPSTLTIAAGEVVEWVWRSGGHNVRPSSTPSGSTWSGTAGGDGTTYDEGYTYRHQFTVLGQYDYYCAPHRSLGMTGQLTVE